MSIIPAPTCAWRTPFTRAPFPSTVMARISKVTTCEVPVCPPCDRRPVPIWIDHAFHCGRAPMPAQNPTRCLTSSPQMAAKLQRKCDHSHVHQQLTSSRCRDATYYTIPLIRAILHGMEDTSVAEKKRLKRRRMSCRLSVPSVLAH